ncbi:hypothetical protein CesoFtcFv8_016421 [Champsocephalus esox]|uniref:Uncharacterized protein n=1 Tax=Champsocephalus esox TaxID=159716 RepID=A0AAN8BMH5_9TELE|nr:hypothetical protein CesoFtcFv8_016421 [Champsocephalus esox]
MSRPLLSDPQEKLLSHSILTAARLARRGWTEEGNETGWQFSHFDLTDHTSVSRPDGNQDQKRAEILVRELGNMQVHILNNRKTAKERVTGSDQKADEAKHTQAERETGLCSQTGVLVWASGCSPSCRRPKRFKAPILPVIAEM